MSVRTFAACLPSPPTKLLTYICSDQNAIIPPEPAVTEEFAIDSGKKEDQGQEVHDPYRDDKTHASMIVRKQGELLRCPWAYWRWSVTWDSRVAVLGHTKVYLLIRAVEES